MSSDSASRPRRTAGVSAIFAAEAATATESTGITYDNIGFVAKKLLSFVRLSNEISEDAAISMAEELTVELAYAFASKEDDCGFNGDGTSTYGGIRGVTNLIIDGSHNASKSAAASTHNTFLTLDVT